MSVQGQQGPFYEAEVTHTGDRWYAIVYFRDEHGERREIGSVDGAAGRSSLLVVATKIARDHCDGREIVRLNL